jgi:hypothetical protein
MNKENALVLDKYFFYNHSPARVRGFYFAAPSFFYCTTQWSRISNPNNIKPSQYPFSAALLWSDGRVSGVCCVYICTHFVCLGRRLPV